MLFCQIEAIGKNTIVKLIKIFTKIVSILKNIFQILLKQRKNFTMSSSTSINPNTPILAS